MKQPFPVLRYVAWILIPLASLLSFSIQPLLGKLLLPACGGTAATWLGVMLYFQAALLGGYFLADRLIRLHPKTQALVISTLAAVALVSLRINAPESASPTIVWIFGYLAVRTGPAIVLLFCLSPLLHAWAPARDGKVPYFLYGVSNAGSLSGLLLYPFIIERHSGLKVQIASWSIMFCIAVLLSIVAAYLYFRGPWLSVFRPGPTEKVTWTRRFCWTALSMLTCVNMLSATQYISGEIGSTPLTWVGPFGVYLLSFILIFAGFWRTAFSRFATGCLAAATIAYIVSKGMTATTVSGHTLHLLLLVTGMSCFVGNSILYALRPTNAFSVYYLCLAFGGVLGGILSSVVLPGLFTQPFEFILTSISLLAIGAICFGAGERLSSRILTAFVATFALCFLTWRQVFPDEQPESRFEYFRNIYGFSTINTTENGVILSNETTTHGTQVTKSPEGRRQPTMYYSESTAAGVVLERLKQTRASLSIAVVGLGAGTLSAYLRPSDSLHFWEIDPKAISIAQRYFSYINDSAGKVYIHRQDGRRGINEISVDFDVIIIDAFVGDSIPSHLVTSEALAIYKSKLAKRDGVLLIHASNRYSNLFPVLSATARLNNQSAINIQTDITESTPTRDYDKTPTQYIMIIDPQRAGEAVLWFPVEEDDGRVKRRILLDQNIDDSTIVSSGWTDDRSSILDALDFSKYWK
ncbi:MAG TPA: fused MFS/spermidine synthase [Opitutaceae bacterium]|nr:fused MFS/spermidine synthase [Opitutaceae bacterium]